MMRLLFLCLLLLLPAAAAVTEDAEGSAEGDVVTDDEDLTRIMVHDVLSDASTVDKTTGEGPDQLLPIVIGVALTVLALSVVAIVAIILVRRKTHNRQQGIYSVPTEQDQKGPI
ncbi:unnamed protein product [Ophioblennius macclurei]